MKPTRSLHTVAMSGVALLCLAMLQPAAAEPAAPTEVHWLLYDLPPLYITQGPQQGQGTLDRLLREALLPRLPGYDHRIVPLPPRRLEATLRQQTNACVFGMLKNAERETFLHFSRPFPISVAPALLVRSADVPRWRELMDAQGRLSLAAWLQRTDTRLGLADGRAYGAAVDALVASQPGGGIEKVTGHNPTLNLMQMLKHQRIDGLLVLPFEPGELARAAGIDLDEVQALPLSEQGPARTGHVACTRSPLGAEVVRRANAVLGDAAFGRFSAGNPRRP